MKFGNLNFLEPSGPLQACNGIALPLRYVALQNCKATGNFVCALQQEIRLYAF